MLKESDHLKRILFSLMTMVAVLSVAGVGSLAYFSDTETSTGNSFTAGTLDLKIWQPDSSWVDEPDIPQLISTAYWDSGIGSLINNLKPGDEGTIIVPIRNDGSVDGDATLQFTNLTDYENGVNKPECEAEGGTWGGGCIGCVTGCEDPGPGQGELSQHLDIVIYYGSTKVASRTLWQLLDSIIVLGELGAYGEEDVVMEFSLDYDVVDNIIQSDSVDFDITFELIQPKP
jgi:spore coat-associated protein N